MGELRAELRAMSQKWMIRLKIWGKVGAIRKRKIKKLLIILFPPHPPRGRDLT